MFSLYALQFSLWELIKSHRYQKPPTGFYFNIVVLQIPHSVFLSPPAAPAVGTVTTGPWMYLRILSSVSVGLLHFSSLDQWVGVSHLHGRSKASNSICDTGDQPHGLGVPPPRLLVSVCKRAYISYSNLKLRQKRHRSLAETHTTVILASV